MLNHGGTGGLHESRFPSATSHDDKGQVQLRQEPETLWTAHNRAGTDCTTVFVEYLEVIGIRV